VRVVLDTNVLVSALLFTGISSELVPLRQESAITVLLSRRILEEYLRVLSYPKFQLSEAEIKSLTEDELLSYVRVVSHRDVCALLSMTRRTTSFLTAPLQERHESSSPETRTCYPSATTGQSASNRQPSFSAQIRAFGDRSCRPRLGDTSISFNSVPDTSNPKFI